MSFGMAERVGFEPTVRLPAQRFSRPSQSTTLAPLRRREWIGRCIHAGVGSHKGPLRARGESVLGGGRQATGRRGRLDETADGLGSRGAAVTATFAAPTGRGPARARTSAQTVGIDDVRRRRGPLRSELPKQPRRWRGVSWRARQGGVEARSVRPARPCGRSDGASSPMLRAAGPRDRGLRPSAGRRAAPSSPWVGLPAPA